MTTTTVPAPTTEPVARANDAANRGVRTLVQGLVVDVVIAVAATLLTVLAGAPSDITWAVVGISVGKSALTALLSYVMRMRDTLPGLLSPLLTTTIVTNAPGATLNLGTAAVTVTDDIGAHSLDRTELQRAAAADAPADPTL